jgi:hypothetical protein
VNLLSALEDRYRQTGDEIFAEASDALSLEQLLADKTYRALIISLYGKGSDSDRVIIEEALFSYEMSRLREVSNERD